MRKTLENAYTEELIQEVRSRNPFAALEILSRLTEVTRLVLLNSDEENTCLDRAYRAMLREVGKEAQKHRDENLDAYD